MPGKDGTGPMGPGTLGGKAQGGCWNAPGQDLGGALPDFAGRGGRWCGAAGAGRRQGRRAGRCWGGGFENPPAGGKCTFRGGVMPGTSPEQELQALRERAEQLRQLQEEIARRMAELQATPDK